MAILLIQCNINEITNSILHGTEKGTLNFILKEQKFLLFNTVSGKQNPGHGRVNFVPVFRPIQKWIKHQYAKLKL